MHLQPRAGPPDGTVHLIGIRHARKLEPGGVHDGLGGAVQVHQASRVPPPREPPTHVGRRHRFASQQRPSQIGQGIDLSAFQHVHQAHPHRRDRVEHGDRRSLQQIQQRVRIPRSGERIDGGTSEEWRVDLPDGPTKSDGRGEHEAVVFGQPEYRRHPVLEREHRLVRHHHALWTARRPRGEHDIRRVGCGIGSLSFFLGDGHHGYVPSGRSGHTFCGRHHCLNIGNAQHLPHPLVGPRRVQRDVRRTTPHHPHHSHNGVDTGWSEDTDSGPRKVARQGAGSPIELAIGETRRSGTPWMCATPTQDASVEGRRRFGSRFERLLPLRSEPRQGLRREMRGVGVERGVELTVEHPRDEPESGEARG